MSDQLHDLKEKILAFFPELAERDIDLDVGFDASAGKYTVKLLKAGEKLVAYLDKQDAEECLAGKKCLNLAVLITQLITDFEAVTSSPTQ